MDKQSRVVIVTGAGQGIGRTYAHAFAERGDRVAVVDINAEAVDRVAAEVRAAGGDAIGVACDVSSQESVRAMVDAVVAAFGTVHVLVNNAAIFSTLTMKPFEEISTDEWNRVFAVNALGVMLCCQAVAPHMKAQRFGRIVNISSSVVTTGRANYAHYVASKGAVQALNKSLATELGPFEVTANVVSPHGIVTEVERDTIREEQWDAIIEGHAIKRKGKPEDVVAAVLFFASDEAGFITGQTLLVDAGLRYS
ncbi:SDR family NAD(P)-dependent oxidoreductase [Agrococcus sp. 1P02AA]|uniref:SDR family NAD(P)-dependent oxidoreductase n=1 Tax=Agrococcus sp. 1P02AA TaxID=3132259 RepID=UPI0039A42496